jgi:hypothetical protein
MYIDTANGHRGCHFQEVSHVEGWENIGEGWFAHRTSPFYITDVNITAYNPESALLIWNNDFLERVGWRDSYILTATFFTIMSCTNSFLIVTGHNSVYMTWNYCSVVNCTVETGLFYDFGSAYFFRNCFFELTGNFIM